VTSPLKLISKIAQNKLVQAVTIFKLKPTEIEFKNQKNIYNLRKEEYKDVYTEIEKTNTEIEKLKLESWEIKEGLKLGRCRINLS